jgi:hypothetical protein
MSSKEVIKAFGELISELQEDNHAIILAIDANQMLITLTYNISPIEITTLISTTDIKAKKAYTSHLQSQSKTHKLYDLSTQLPEAAQSNIFNPMQVTQLPLLDQQLSEVFFRGEHNCLRDDMHRSAWSRKLQRAGNSISYWKK